MWLRIRKNIVVRLARIELLLDSVGVLRLVLKLESYTIVQVLDLFCLSSVDSMIYILISRINTSSESIIGLEDFLFATDISISFTILLIQGTVKISFIIAYVNTIVFMLLIEIH